MDHLRSVEDIKDASRRGTDRGQVPLVPFDEVYQRHSHDVYRYCLARLANTAAAEDAAADAFMKAFSAYLRVRPGSDGVRLWLFRIAGNVVNDHYRRQLRGRRLLSALVGRLGAAHDPEAQAILGVEVQGVLEALATLSPRERQLVGLRAGAGLPFSDIAALTEMNENSARVATHRALQRLRAVVGSPR
ncbi:MAG: RNA polymerase sigma factor [Candidatus Dormibacteria bacterium]